MNNWTPRIPLPLSLSKMETRGILGGLVASVAVAAFLGWAWTILNWVWVEPRRLERCLRQQGLSGKSYRFLFGDLKEEIKMAEEAKSRPIHFSNDIVARVIPLPDQIRKTHGLFYPKTVFFSFLRICLVTQETWENAGENFFTWVGPKPRLHITDPELIKTLFSNINEFDKPDPHPQFVLLVSGLVSYGGAKWAKHRKIINPAFHSEKLKIMWPAFYQSCCDMISEWEKLTCSVDNRYEFDVWPSLQDLTRDVISRTAFGSSYKEGERVFELQRKLAELVVQAVQSVYIPGWRFLPTKLNRRIKETDREIQDLLVALLKRRETAMKAGETTEDDLLNLLIESNLKEIEGHGNDERLGMSMQDVIDECKLFYLAGQETTSALLVWTIILLSVHQDWQEKAREEVFRVFGANNKPDFDGLNRLKIVTVILYEVLRLYPPVTTLNRKVEKETKLGSISLPQGVSVTIPTLMVHHDRDLWGDDVGDFKPERFFEGVSMATRGKVSFFPFGWGARICIGQNFAMVESKMAMAMILQRFSFEMSPLYVHSPWASIFLQPQHEAHIILKKL